MIVIVDIMILTVMLITAVLALRVRDLLTAVALLSAYSLFSSLLFAGLLALDVALVEAALGAALTGVLLIVAIMHTTRHSPATEDSHKQWLMGVLIVGFLGLMLYSSSGLPDRGDPQAPNRTGAASVYLTRSLEDTATPNVVTAVLADYRSLDTLGETLVIVTAALGVTLVL
ncbi:MAG: hydrogen gas-evolving membrane-bound hydrogenase subunit E, partial [Nitriliruptoraceae bacterium]